MLKETANASSGSSLSSSIIGIGTEISSMANAPGSNSSAVNIMVSIVGLKSCGSVPTGIL